MAHNVSNEYKQVIYSGDTRNKLKLLFNNVELQDADRYCEKLTVKSRIVPNGAKIFSLNNFISKEADLILHDIDTSIIQDQVSISIGTLVGNSYEYVPIGIFNIQDTPTNDKNKTTIKLRDNSVKFDFNYNAQPLIEENGGIATKLQILQDICSQANVTCNITSFLGYLDEIGVYDNTITAREYISRIAEQAGRIATINRSGELIFVDLNNLATWEIPIEIVEKYENGTKYKIGRVVYEDGIVRYETPTSNDDTLFLDSANNYINGELIKDQANSSDNSYYLENTGEANLAYFELNGKTTQETRNGYNLLNVVVSSGTNHGVTFTVNEDKSITINGTNDGTTSWFRLAPNFTLPAGTYTLSNGNSNAIYTTGIFMDDNHNFATENTTTKTFESAQSISPYIRVYAGVTINNLTIRPMIVEGSYTSETMPQYESYGASPSPDFPSELVSVGYKNLLNVDKSNIFSPTTETGFRAIMSVNEGIITFNGRPTTSGGTNMYFNSFQVEESGDYRLSTNMENPPTGSSTNMILQESSDNSSWSTLFEFSSSSVLQSTIVELDKNLYYRLRFYGQSTTIFANTIFKPALTKGITNCAFIPYGKYGIEIKTRDNENNNNTYLYTLDNALRSIGNTKDLLYIKNNILCVDRKIGNIILDGSESWFSTATTTSMYRYDLIYNDLKLGYKNALSNKFTMTNETNFGVIDTICFATHPTSHRFMFWSNETSTSNWKNWLSTHNTEVQYILAEPYTEELGQVNMPSTYDDITYLNILSGTNTNSYLQYRQSKTQLEAILENTNQFSIDSLKTGKILGNPAIDSYDLIQIHDKSKNLLGIPNVNYSGYGLNIKSGNGLITITGTTTSTIVYDFNLISSISSNLGTLTKSLNANGTYNGLQTSLRNNSGDGVGLWSDNGESKTNTISGDAYKFRIQINSGITINTTFKPQIEVGNIETDYVTFKDKIYTTLATNDLVYTGVSINTFDTQIGEEAKEQNVFINGEETFKKWARTTIDNVEGTINLQAGQINEANGRINETNLRIDKDGALLNVLANNSNIEVQYDNEGNPLSGEVREVKTTTGFRFDSEGMTIEDSDSNFKALHRNDGTYYKEGDNVVGQYTKDGSKQKDLQLFGVYYYGMKDKDDTPMFVAQLYTDGNGEEAFGHFYNRGD